MPNKTKLIIGGAILAVLVIVLILFNTVFSGAPKVDPNILQNAADSSKQEPPPPPATGPPVPKAKPRGMGG